MSRIMTVPEIVDAFGGPTKFGRACGFHKHPGARGWDIRKRESIPVEYWPNVLREGKRLGLGITSDVLVAAHMTKHRKTA
jgi:hypothetical protein